MPNDQQVGVYLAVLHYLKAVEQLHGEASDGAKVVAKMKDMSTEDPLFGKGYILEDGRKVHPNYILIKKTPQESKGQWDYSGYFRFVP